MGFYVHVFSSPEPELTGTVTVYNSSGQLVTANATALVGPNEWNSTHFVALQLSGNISGQSTVSGTGIYYGATGNITLIGSSNSMILSAPGGTATQFNYMEVPYDGAHQYNIGAGGGWAIWRPNTEVYVVPFILSQNASMSRLDIPCWMTVTTTSATASMGLTMAAGLYSLSGGNTYSLINSSTIVIRGTFGSASAKTYTVSNAGSSSSISGTGAHLNFLANKWMGIPYAKEITTGLNYAFMYSISTAGNASVLAFSNIGAIYGGGGGADIWGGFGPLVNSSQMVSRTNYDRQYGGTWSRSSAALPTSIATNAVSNYSNGVAPICVMLAV
jgi:hypothetical protein